MAPTRGRANHEEAKTEATSKDRQANNSTKPRRVAPSATTSGQVTKNGHVNQSTGSAATNGTNGENVEGVSGSQACSLARHDTDA